MTITPHDGTRDPATRSNPAAVFFRRDAGEVINIGAAPVTVVIGPELSNGVLMVHEQEFPPLATVPVHRHCGTAQFSRVVCGTLCVLAGSQIQTLRQGDAFYRPPGMNHAVWNPSSTQPARQIEVSFPGEATYRLFRACQDAGQLTPAALSEIAAAYGTAYDHDLTRRIEHRYHVSAYPRSRT